MNGAMLTYKPGRETPDTKLIEGSPTLDELQAGVAGDIELVPLFGTIELVEGHVEKCVVFCNENGKLEGMPINAVATSLWDKALRRRDGQGLYRANGDPADVLVGPIVVIVGDDELLEAL